MGLIINIDEALRLRTDYNILREPLHAMLTEQQEAWEKKNPIDLLFRRSSLGTFQETYTSSIGFDHAFKETGDYAVGPIFNTAEGFSATYRTRTFQGGFIITQQTLEDRQLGRARDDASAFIKRWHGDIVEYCMTAIDAGFGTPRYYQGGNDGVGSKLLLNSADTASGEIDDTTKNPLFSNKHTIVKRKDKSYSFAAKTAINTSTDAQSNMYYADIDPTSSTDQEKVSKLADYINMVITEMENYRDDNGKRAGVLGAKRIVCGNDARLKACLEAAMSMDMFGQQPNPAYKRATVETTPYLNDTNCCGSAKGFFIIDDSYNAANHGLELTERIPLTLEAFNHREAPQGIKYDGRQRFDVNVASWRGIAYCGLHGGTSATATDWNYTNNFTSITPMSIVKPVAVVGTVTTQAAN